MMMEPGPTTELGLKTMMTGDKAFRKYNNLMYFILE